MSRNSENETVQEPSMAKNSSPSRAPKTGAQLRDNLEEREKWPKRQKKPFIAAITATAKKHRTSLCCTTGMSTDSRDELNLRHLHCEQHHCR